VTNRGAGGVGAGLQNGRDGGVATEGDGRMEFLPEAPRGRGARAREPVPRKAPKSVAKAGDMAPG
jgi:hypothetical protein